MSDDREHEAEAPEQDITSEVPEHLSEEEDGVEEAVPEEIGPEEATAPEAAEEEAEEPAGPAPKLERLQKILAAAGIASRRHAEELITGGHVQVNGQTVTQLGSKADPDNDHIRVDGKLLRGPERLRYFMLNKPKGYVTTVSDPEGRPTVMEFFSRTGERLYPVGRLDYLSEGLLLVTNDGELANGLTKASSKVDKTYLVKVSGQPDDESLDRLREGVSIDRTTQGEGKVRTAPARIRQVREGENPWFEVVLIEGRNRELRKMFEEIGHHVEKIRRVGYGPLVLDVEPGKLRELDLDEIEALRLTAAGKFKPKRMKTKKMLPKDAGKPVSYDDDRPRSQRVAARPTGTRPPRAEFGKPAGGFAKREGGFSKPAGGFTKREGGFAKPAGGFAKREGGFAKREGGFTKPAGGFAKREDRPVRREGGFTKPAGGFAKREGGFTKPAGGFAKPSGKFERPAKPFRPAASRPVRPAGEGGGFAPRGEEFTPRRGGTARFGRPEGGRTGNRPGGRNDERGRSGASPARPFRSERPQFERPAAPRREAPAPTERFTPRKPSRLRIDAVESDQSTTSRPAAPRAARPTFQKPAFDRPRPAREGQDSFRKGPGSTSRPASARPASARPASARPPRGQGSTRRFTTSTGIPRPGGARPSSKPARPGGRPAGAGFGSKPGSRPGSRPSAGAGRPAGKPAWKPKPGGAGKPAGGGRSKPRPGGFSKPSGFKPKPGGARRSGPRPGGKRNG